MKGAQSRMGKRGEVKGQIELATGEEGELANWTVLRMTKI